MTKKGVNEKNSFDIFFSFKPPSSSKLCGRQIGYFDVKYSNMCLAIDMY